MLFLVFCQDSESFFLIFKIRADCNTRNILKTDNFPRLVITKTFSGFQSDVMIICIHSSWRVNSGGIIEILEALLTLILAAESLKFLELSSFLS